QLSSGDSVSLGPVVFHFKPMAQEVTAPRSPGPERVADLSTRIVNSEDVRKRPQKALAPVNADVGELSKLARSSTRAMPAVRGNGASAALALEPDEEPSQPQSRALSAAERARIRRESPGFSG